MKRLIFLIFVIGMLLSSCITWSRLEYFWRGDFLTVNVNESLNRVEITPMEKKFANVFYPFDSQLTLLLRRLLCLQEKGFVSQIKEMAQKYPWLEGAVYIETHREKEEKRISTLRRMGQDIEIQRIEKLYPGEKTGEGYLVEKIEGKERLLLIKKENKGEKRSSFMILVLDLTSLKKDKFSKTHPPLAVVGEGKVLINEGISKVWLRDVRWRQLLNKGSRGRVTLDSKTYFWMMRYIGDVPLFYIVGG